MGAHVIGITLMLLAFGIVIVGAAFVFAVTAERESELSSRAAPPPPRTSRHPSSPR